MPKNKTRRSSATPPDRLVKVARVKTATARATKIFNPPYIIPLAHTVSPMSLTSTSNYPYTVMQTQYKSFIAELNKILTNEKIIDRGNKAEFKELLKEQQSYNKILYKINPKNIVCFVVCDYYEESRILNKGNNYKGTASFNELLHENNMGMIWLNYNTIYIYNNI